jgi:hypothetical protein
MGKQTLYVNDEQYGPDWDGQLPRIRLNAQIDFYKFEKIPYKFVVVNLNGTVVAASHLGIQAFHRDDVKGWFTESVTVTMGFSLPRITIEQDSPSTTMGSAATTSSTAIGINENLGTFGPVPTTGIGAGITIGNSFTANVTDFRITNDSSNTQVVHHYLLAASRGGPFNQPQDLVNLSAEGQFEGTPLFDPPPLAISNLPILSQAIFLTPPDVGDSPLTIHITHTLLKVEKTFEVFVTQVNASRRTWSYQWAPLVPLSQV